jgi:hypothetical protein
VRAAHGGQKNCGGQVYEVSGEKPDTGMHPIGRRKKGFASGDHFWPNLDMLPNCERQPTGAKNKNT